MLEITSKDNPRLKKARAVRDGRESDEIFIEGLRLAEEAVAANLDVIDYFWTPEFAESARAANLLNDLQMIGGAQVSAKILESIAATKTPQGVILIAAKPETGKTVLNRALNRASEAPLLVILHELNNPNNVGAVLRTAEAANCASAILTVSSADVFSAKSLRAAMGSAFRLPVWERAGFTEAIEFCRSHNIKTVCAELNADKSHTEIDWTIPRALIIGSEAHGLSATEIALADENLKIPMNESVESLNAAVACGVILYEAQRQRGESKVQSSKSKV